MNTKPGVPRLKAMPPPDRRFPRPPQLPLPDKRSGSSDSFPALSDSDRLLLSNVLEVAKDAIERSNLAAAKESRERTALEGYVKAKFNDVETDVGSIANDVRGMRGDIRELTKTMIANMRDDVSRDRDLSRVKVAIAKESKVSGAKWGALVASIITGISTIVYLLVQAYAVSKGAPPPRLPEAPSAPSH
jgi:hypothetical protein